MTRTQERDSQYLKRYKSYPIDHFSRWRTYLQMFIVLWMLQPYLKWVKKYKIYGQRRIPRNNKMIVVSNHISTLDPPMISVALRRPIAYMAKKELFQSRGWAEFYRSQGCFALDRDNPDSATLKTALNVLKSEAPWSLGIFPEGTRSTTGQILPLKKGVGSLAQKSHLPVLPVGIFKDETGRYNLTIGDLITDIQDAEEVQEAVHQALVKLADPSWDRTDW